MSDEHLPLDELAELDEGMLDPERTSAARAHLDTCAQCRAGADAITSTRATLAAMPPEPMPDDVKARLDRALANEAAPAATVVPNLDAHRERRFGRPSLPASAAASVILLAFAAIIVAAVIHSGGGATSSGGASEAANSPTGLPNSTAIPVQPKTYTRTSTGQTYTPSRLLAVVPGLVTRLPAASAAGGLTPANSGASAPAASPGPQFSAPNRPVPAALRPLYDSRSKLLACAAYLSSTPNAVPLTVDFGRWTNGALKGAPVAVFVMRDPSPEVVDVYVTGPACNGGSLRTFVKVPVQ